MLVADSHEFIELYRGDKDVRLGQEMVRLEPDLRYVSFAPNAVSLVERSLVGKKRLTQADLPAFPERMEVRLLSSVALRFARKEVGGILAVMPGYGRALRQLRPDVILENPYTWLTPRSYQTDAAARHLGIPVVYYDPGDDVSVSFSQRVLLPFERPVVNRAAAIITYNEVGRRRFVDKYGYPAERIHVIPKPIDVRRWRRPDLRDQVRASLGITPDTFVIAHPGRLTRMRGSHILAEAARVARDDVRFTGAVFLFIGGTLASESDPAVYEGPNTQVTGMRPNDDVPGLLAASDVVVFPDLATKAGFTTALAEALAAAKPVVVGVDPAQGALPLTDGVDCAYVEPGSVQSLLNVLASLKSEPQRARALGDAAGAFASARMDYSQVAREYLDILERVVANGCRA